jgi:general secretion pathway protein M
MNATTKLVSLVPNAWRSRYNALAPREQQVLKYGVLIAAILLCYWWVWMPAQLTIAKLETNRADQTATLSALQAASGEVKPLRDAVNAAKLKANPDQAMLRAALVQSGIEPASVEIQLEGNKSVRIAAAKISATAWLNWLAVVQREYALVVREANIVSVDRQTGLIRVSATLNRI